MFFSLFPPNILLDYSHDQGRNKEFCCQCGLAGCRGPKVSQDSIVAAAERIVWQLIHRDLGNPIEHDTTTSLTSLIQSNLLS